MLKYYVKSFLINIFCFFIFKSSYRKLIRRSLQTKYIPYKSIDENALAYFENIELQKQFIYESKKDINKKNILFIARLGKIGGIETRILKTIPTLEKYFNIFILSPIDHYKYIDLIKQKNIFTYQTNFLRNPDNLTLFIKKIIAIHNIDIVEFEYGYFWQLNYKELKINNAKLVGAFHHHLDHHRDNTINNHIYKELNNFDAVIKIKENLGLPTHHNSHIISNGVIEIKNYYQLNNSKNCLIISRISKDKLKSITKFIEFAIKNNINPILAGFIDNKKIYNFLQKKYNLKNENFIGYINTISHLKEFNNKYLFICGVAQVPMEAIAFGYPCLTTSESERVAKNNWGLTFVKKSNWKELYDNNFGIVKNNDGSELSKDFKNIQHNNLEDFKLIDDIKDFLDINIINMKYIDILNNLTNK